MKRQNLASLYDLFKEEELRALHKVYSNSNFPRREGRHGCSSAGTPFSEFIFIKITRFEQLVEMSLPTEPVAHRVDGPDKIRVWGVQLTKHEYKNFALASEKLLKLIKRLSKSE